MARKSARVAEKLLIKSPSPNCADSSKTKPTTIKQYFTVLDPYVSIEKLNLETPKKLFPIKAEKKEDSQSSEESNEENETPVKSVEKKKESDVNTKSAYELSEYEKLIQQNIEERRKMFQELIGEAKKDLQSEVNRDKINKATQRGLKRKMDESIEIPTLRMSLRSRKSPKDEFVSIKDNDEIKQSPSAPKFNKSGRFTLADAYLDQESIEDSKFIEEMIPLLEKEGELEKLPADQQDFLKLMKSFTIHEEGVAKVSKSRIYSLAWHPSNCKLLVAVGDRDGNVGFWDIDKLEDKHQGVRAFKVHNQPINCITFDKFNSTRLLTTSYDGYVRCLDLHSNVFDEVYSIKRTKDTWTAYHAQKDPATLIVSQSNGDVAVVDVRTKHPQDENLFMTEPVVSFPKAPKGVHGAFFSPITGQYALTTCTDDTLKLFDVQKGKSEPECIKSIYHNNFTGRWLTPFKAVWHPQRDDIFIVGSMEQPRRVELYSAPSGTLLHNFNGDFLASVTSINAFHPTVPIFAGGNSSGRVHIFRS